jgi:hypothetical protein
VYRTQHVVVVSEEGGRLKRESFEKRGDAPVKSTRKHALTH